MDEIEDPAVKFASADYILRLPLELDKYGMPTAESYNSRIEVILNLLAAGLSVSWFSTEDETSVIVRVSAPEERLSEEAENIELLVRAQDKYRDNYVAENESFVVYHDRDRSLYSNAFIKKGGYRFCSLERMRLVHSIMMSAHDQGGANLGSMKDKILEMYSMHDPGEIEFLVALWLQGNLGIHLLWPWNWHKLYFVPEKEIRDYFGEKIALYAAFASFYTKHLLLLCPFGIACGLAQVLDGEDTFATPIYAVCVSVWATFFLESWRRQESSLRCQWNVEDFENSEGLRDEYYGDQIYIYGNSGTTRTVYNPYLRYLKLAVSMTVLLTLASTVLVSTMCLMLMRIAMSATAGRLGMVLVGIVNFFMIEIMNKVYVQLAVKMTDWENHATQTEYDDQLIAKCFIFQFFNSYSSFFYLAFLEGKVRIFGVEDVCQGNDCMQSLSIQLMTIFVMHTLFGQVMEVFWPWFQGYYAEFKHVCFTSSHICAMNVCRRLKAYFCYIEYEDEEIEALESCVFTEEERNGFRPTFPGVLVDYNELVLQFGYVILFAPAAPLASVLALINNAVELRSDGYKVCKFYRRPNYICAQDIGSWQYIIGVLSVVAVMTNAAIIAFTTDSLSRFNLVGRNDRISQLVIACMVEHVVLVVKLFLHIVMADDHPHVLVRRERRKYEAKKQHQIEEAEETEQEKFEFRQRFVAAPDEFEQHVDDD